MGENMSQHAHRVDPWSFSLPGDTFIE